MAKIELDPAKVRIVATVLAEEILGTTDAAFVDAIVRQVEAQVASGPPLAATALEQLAAQVLEQLAAQVLERRTDALLERARNELALQNVPRSTEKH